jgi:hypothetical protein
LGKKVDITGLRFTRLIVIEDSHRDNDGGVQWKCLCDCGNIVYANNYNLTREKVKSCGCWSTEKCIEASTTHGLSKSKEYQRFLSMKSRCYNPKNRSYNRYGAIGIVVCDRWNGSDGFDKFIEDVGMMPDYEQDWTLERKDPRLNYETGNVIWILNEFQPRNKKKTKRNSSGETGVMVAYDKKQNKRYRAHWTTLDGITKTKSFSVNVYGDEVAWELACNYRKKMIEELNAQGAGYAEKHGQD